MAALKQLPSQTVLRHILLAIVCCCLPVPIPAAERKDEGTPKPLQRARLVPGVYSLRWSHTDAPQVFGAPVLPLAARPVAGLKLPPVPPGAARRYTRLILGAPEREHVLVLEASRGLKGGFDTLYADTDADGRLTADRVGQESGHWPIGGQDGGNRSGTPCPVRKTGLSERPMVTRSVA